MQQLDITRGDLIKSEQTVQINISFSICAISVELIDAQRIATSSQLLHIIPLSRLFLMPFTMVNRSSKLEWNIYLSMPPHFFMSLEELIINILLIFICNVTKMIEVKFLIYFKYYFALNSKRFLIQRQPSRGVLQKRCSKLVRKVLESTCEAIYFLAKLQKMSSFTGVF